jgi:cytochrome b6-f complex iron-sulfur subunit
VDSQQNPDPSAESSKDAPPAADEKGAAPTTEETVKEASAPTGDAPKAPAVPKAAAPPKAVPAAPRPAIPPARETPAGTPPAAKVAPGAAKATSTPTATVAKGIPKAAAAKATGAVVESTPDPPVNKLRRNIVWATVAGFLATSFLMFLRFFLPRAIFEPSSVFRIGFPGDYALGIDTKYQQQYRIWVAKTSDRLFVIYARCTHLGCTPDWKSSENKFKCPCHGSGYDSEGVNFEGPAPRPMDRAHVSLDAEGQIVVDTNRLYDWPKGGTNKFDDPDAYIPL